MTPFTLFYDSNLLFLNVSLLVFFFFFWGGGFFFLLWNCHKVFVFIDF